MRYRLLGTSGLRVSEAALGTMTFGDDWGWGAAKDEARKLSQLQDNLASFDMTITAAQIKALDEASQIDLGFPHDFYAKDMVKGFVYGGLRDKILA